MCVCARTLAAYGRHLLLPSCRAVFRGTRANICFSGGGGIDTFNVEDPAAITVIDSKVHDGVGDDLEAPQDQARPHQAILDPTGDFLVFPDLGADLLRVLKVDKATLKHTEAVCIRSSGQRAFVFP